MALRIAHFSDLHLAACDADFQRSLALVDDALAKGAEHLALTGDLVESGRMDVVEAFLRALKSRGFATADKLSVIPGNHDIFPASVRTLPSWERPTRIWEHFARLTRSTRVGASATELLAGSPYPFGKVLTPEVVLAGVDTTRNGQYLPTRWAEGELPKEQRDAVTNFFAEQTSAKHRVVLMHHHPWTEAFEHGWIEQNFTTPPPKKVAAWLRTSGASLVLCGHVHAEDGIKDRKLGRRCRVFRAGTSGGVEDEDPARGKQRIYHLLDLATNGRVRITAHHFWDR